jgi:hypothetical protein
MVSFLLSHILLQKFFSRFNANLISEPEPTTYPDYSTVDAVGSEKGITYDKNGNILTLNRYGRYSSGTVLFDQLSYQYSGNRLMRVVDANTGNNCAGEFRNTAAPGLQNAYDANGNLTLDVDRNLSPVFILLLSAVVGVAGLYDKDGFTWGDYLLVGIGLASMLFYGSIYGAVDLGVGLTAGTAITDRLGSGLDSALK